MSFEKEAKIYVIEAYEYNEKLLDFIDEEYNTKYNDHEMDDEIEELSDEISDENDFVTIE